MKQGIYIHKYDVADVMDALSANGQTVRYYQHVTGAITIDGYTNKQLRMIDAVLDKKRIEVLRSLVP